MDDMKARPHLWFLVNVARGTSQLRAAARVVVEQLETRAMLSASLNPIADADVEISTADANVANANFGADNELRVSADATDTKEAFLTFDISTVTSVGAATIDLGGGSRDLLVSPQNVSVFAGNSTTWVEGNGLQPTVANPSLNLDDNPLGEIRWNNRTGSVGASLDTVQIDVAQVYSWDVTSYLQAQKAAGATSVSFVFRGTGGVGESVFGSQESSVVPTLNVDDDIAPRTEFRLPRKTRVRHPRHMDVVCGEVEKERRVLVFRDELIGLFHVGVGHVLIGPARRLAAAHVADAAHAVHDRLVVPVARPHSEQHFFPTASPGDSPFARGDRDTFSSADIHRCRRADADFGIPGTRTSGSVSIWVGEGSSDARPRSLS